MGRPDSQPTVVHVELPRRGSSLGTASIVLGVLAFLICWIPFLGAIGIPLSTLGLILGVLGILVSFFRKGASIGMPLAGTIICGIAIFVAGSMTSVLVGTIKSVHEVNQRVAHDANATNQEVISAVGNAFPATTEPAPAIASPAPSDPTNSAEPPVTWASATEPVRQGDVQIRVTSAQVGAVHFAGDAISAPSTSKEIYILLSVELTNISTTHKLDYESWNESTGVGPNSTVLTDNFGNNYRSIQFSAGDNIVGAESYGSIYPGKSLHDVLVFERPLDNVSYLDLELPANYFKGDGKIRLRIPKSMIQFDNPPAK